MRILLASLVASFTLAQDDEDDPGVARRFDDPGLSRRFEEKRPAKVESPPPPQTDALVVYSRYHLALGASYSSLVADPDANDGWGTAIWLGVGPRFGVDFRASFGWHRYVAPFDTLGLDFISGDLTPGVFWAFGPYTPERHWAAFVATGFGPYWMVGLNGLTWSLGVRFGVGAEWRIFGPYALRIEAHYHIFHLKEIAGGTYYDRKSLSTLGAVDRFELPVSLAFHF